MSRDPENPFEVAADDASQIPTPTGRDYRDISGEYFEAEFMPRDCLEPPSREMLRQEPENKVLKIFNL